LLVEHRERPFGRLAGVGELVEEAGAVEILDARHPARVGVGAQVAPDHELLHRVGDRLGVLTGQHLGDVLGAEVHDEPALRRDECEHHLAVHAGVLGRQVREGFEPCRVVHRSHTVTKPPDRIVSRMCRRSVVSRPCRRLRSDVVSDETPSIHIRADELRTVREAMRDLGSLLTELEDGDVEKLVLTQRNRMRAVVVSLESWSKVERALAGKNGLRND
jgi:hypothetical protein